MAYAVIDLGSNSIRLSVYECKDDQIYKVFSRKEVAGLAGYISKGVLGEAGLMKAGAVIKDFKNIALRFTGLSDIHLVAAASLRNIHNRDEAVGMIARETSLSPYVLEGEEEAALSFVGASHYIGCESGLMMDIGGASTELVLVDNFKTTQLVSLPIGCLNLSVNFVKKVIPTEAESKKIRAAIKDQLSAVGWDTHNSKSPVLLGAGGTVRAALKLARGLCGAPPESQVFSAACVNDISERLRKAEDGIYMKLYQIIPERLMTISTGLAILQQVIGKFGCETISVSEFGVREGYLIERVLGGNGRYFINKRNGHGIENR